MSNQINNRLLEGKSNLSHIVCIEPYNDKAEVFIEKNGEVTSQWVPNRYWILSSTPKGPDWVELKGKQHYKWGKQFTSFDSYIRYRIGHKNDDIYNIFDVKESLMVKDGFTYYKGMQANEVSILSIDIETTSLKYKQGDKVLLISNTFRKNGKIERKLFAYDEYDTQAEMVDAWCQYIQECNPSIICGHNFYSFDLPYLAKVAEDTGTSLALGRDGSDIKFNDYESKVRKDGSQSYSYHKVKCYGRELIDTFFLALKYDIQRKYESYGLKNIIKQEGLVVEGRVYYDASTIKDNYHIPEEWDKIKAYCQYDSDEALMLFDLMSPALFYATQITPRPFQLMLESATGAQINSIMVRSYLQDGFSIPKSDEEIKYEGAISIGVPAIYKNVLSFDVASLYPSIMLQYKVENREKDPEGNLLKILEILTEERLRNKKLANETGDKYWKDLEQSRKVFINSMYGQYGAGGLNFNYPSGAAFITMKGREILDTAIQFMTGKNYEYWRNLNKEDNSDV